MNTDGSFDEAELEAARILFARQASFMMGAVSVDGLIDLLKHPFGFELHHALLVPRSDFRILFHHHQ